MEQREEPRFPANQPVDFSILGLPNARHAGRIINVSESGIRLDAPVALIPGAFLRIWLDDSVLFGEVKYCSSGEGGYAAGVYVERVLLGKSKLSRLLAEAIGAH